MAGSQKRIRTPLREHLRQMRYQLIPVVVFLSGIYGTVLLWRKHVELPNGIGAVKALRVDIVSPIDGILVRLPGLEKQLDMFDSVAAGAIVCKLDDAAVSATIDTLKAEAKQLNMQLAATDAQMKLDFAARRADKSDRRQALLDEARRLAVDLERTKLDVSDRTILLESNRIGLKRCAEKLAIIKDLFKKKLETQYVLVDTQLQHDVLEREIVEREKAILEAREMEVKARARMDEYSKMVREEDALREALDPKGDSKATTQPYAVSILREIDVFIEPIKAAVATQEARVREVEIQLERLDIRVPPSVVSMGTIVEIYRMPGQAVRAGEPIMRIANLDSMYIVSYVRQHRRVKPEAGSTVFVQFRSIPRKGAFTTIEKIGPQIEAIPTRQLRDPNIDEWGLPVKIYVPNPQELHLTPGELVDITY